MDGSGERERALLQAYRFSLSLFLSLSCPAHSLSLSLLSSLSSNSPSLIFKLLLHLLFSVYTWVCMHLHTCHGAHVEVRELTRASSLLTPCRFLALNPGLQASQPIVSSLVNSNVIHDVIMT